MRTKRLYSGLNNSQKIRVILNGVHIYTTVGSTTSMFGVTSQRIAVDAALVAISDSINDITGIATRVGDVDVQVDIL